MQAANEKAREFGKINSGVEALNVPGSVKVRLTKSAVLDYASRGIRIGEDAVTAVYGCPPRRTNHLHGHQTDDVLVITLASFADLSCVCSSSSTIRSSSASVVPSGRQMLTVWAL